MGGRPTIIVYRVLHDQTVTHKRTSEWTCTILSSGTVAEAVKFHDDKSMYTGAYAANVGAAKDTKVRADWKSGRNKPVGPAGMKSVFNAFCAFGGGSSGAMDNAKFAKCCNDSGLINRKFTSTDADIIFSKVKVKGKVLRFIHSSYSRRRMYYAAAF